MLTAIWEYVEQCTGQLAEQPVVWPPEMLQIAQQIARQGRADVARQDGESAERYAVRVTMLGKYLPSVPIYAADTSTFHTGVQASFQAARSAHQNFEQTTQAIRKGFCQAFDAVGDKRALLCDTVDDGGPRLHEALRGYIEWLKTEYRHPESGITAWGQVKIKQVETLLGRHEDTPLSRVGHDAIEAMMRYWRQRPARKGSTEAVSRKSAEHQIAALKAFFRWLARSNAYEWQKPTSFDDIRTRVDRRADDAHPQIQPEVLFSLDELILLNTYATPLERLFLLLGVNCGYSRAEIATLRVGDICLRQAHTPSHQEILNFKSTNQDSFIKRCRPKTGVYGEHLLFAQTVQAIEWALSRRMRQPDFGPNARLLLNSNGEPYNKPTKGGNPNRQIQNRFDALLRRIERHEKQVKKRPFKTLRKTAGDLVRRFSDGEVTAVFHCRGQVVKIDNLADCYTTRPFSKVFEALRKVEIYLGPMFTAAGSHPFEPEGKK